VAVVDVAEVQRTLEGERLADQLLGAYV